MLAINNQYFLHLQTEFEAGNCIILNTKIV